MKLAYLAKDSAAFGSIRTHCYQSARGRLRLCEVYPARMEAKKRSVNNQ